MIKRYLFHFVWVSIVIILIVYAVNYKGGEDAMLAQVESNATAISYRKPVLVTNIYVTPGQVVDSGDLLIEVERPGMDLLIAQHTTKKDQLLRMLLELENNYENSVKLIKTEKNMKSVPLLSERDRIEHDLKLLQANAKIIDSINSLSFNVDTQILEKKLSLIDNQLLIIESNYILELSKLENTFNNNRFQINSEITLIDQELEELNIEMVSLQKRAEKSCTIGNVFVQLDELVPPFTTLMSLYDLTPTQIKAFVAEGSVEKIEIGAPVIVKSINRVYEVQGQIVEIGSRVTAYPEKISPILNMKHYGQEIFISIPRKNNFLNGEKVYVYVIEE